MAEFRVGIIGGSGLYNLEGVESVSEQEIETPFGRPSAPVVTGKLSGVSFAFIARHGVGHRYSPSEVPYAANIYALKSIGVRHIIGISAVGSLREEIEPKHFVIADQIFDRTKGIRRHTFFGDGVVGHIGFAEPFCERLRKKLIDVSKSAGITIHTEGIYVCMEGPQFSTRAESNTYRKMGMDVIGMTAIPEAKLAREAGICYATIALVTDYDVWRSVEEEVTIEMVLANMKHNTTNVKKILPGVIKALDADRENCHSGCGEFAVITASDARSAEKMKKLKVILED